jgi:hypothetical protein
VELDKRTEKLPDFIGQPIELNDYVVINKPGRIDRVFGIGRITRFTPKMVRVEYGKRDKSELFYPHDLVKIDPEQMILYKLNPPWP